MGLFETLHMQHAFLGIGATIADAIAAHRLPDWSDAAAVRQWLLDMRLPLKVLASRTSTTLDDATVALVDAILVDDRLWGLCVEAFQQVAGGRQYAIPTMEGIKLACSDIDHNTGSLNPAVIMALVRVAAAIVEAIRSSNQPAKEFHCCCKPDCPQAVQDAVEMAASTEPEAVVAEPTPAINPVAEAMDAGSAGGIS